MIAERGVDDWIRNIRRRDSTLTREEERALRDALSEVVTPPADYDVVREHDRQTNSHLLLEGWAGRYITLADGRRQIVALHVPGDFVDLHSFPLQIMDHSVATFTPCRIALAAHDRLRVLTASHPHLARLLWLSTLIDASILRQWLVGSGKRSALEQTAHLFCELFVRLQLTGRTEGQMFLFPLSQVELADCLGVSSVHANRILQELRATEVLAWRGRHVEILDWERLQTLAEFDPFYLNLVDSPRRVFLYEFSRFLTYENVGRRRAAYCRPESEDDVISIVQHGVPGSEILARRLASMRGQIGTDVLESCAIDRVRRDYAPGQAVFQADAAASEVLVLASGVAAEARLLADGRRQILALRFPGDALTPKAGEVLVALTRVRAADGAGLMRRLADSSAEFLPLRRAWVAAGLTDQAILRDQVVRLGRMSAFERVAHILLEAHERLAQVGLATGSTFHLPLTQEMVGDVIGLSVVHLNRTLQALRRGGLVASRQGYVTLAERERLVEISAYVSRFPRAWCPDATRPARRPEAARTDARQPCAIGEPEPRQRQEIPVAWTGQGAVHRPAGALGG